MIHLWTSGPHESVTRINLKKRAGIRIEAFKEQLRAKVREELPEARISFEPGDLVDQVLNLGANNPIEVAILGKNLASSYAVARDLRQHLSEDPVFRDVQVATPLDYPTLKIQIDRVKAGQLGLTVKEISEALVTATSSSRFTEPNYWRDPESAVAYQVQVEYPQYLVADQADVELVPITSRSGEKVFLRDVAQFETLKTPAAYDRLNQQRYVTVTANTHATDLGRAVKRLDQAIVALGDLPPGVQIVQKGQVDLLGQTTRELQLGLFIAIVVIVLMLAASFQSFRAAAVILMLVPAVVAGSLLLLLLTGHTLNIQSYMGMIMAVGVAVANAILFVTRAEDLRKSGASSAYRLAAENRVRPILMTSLTMIVGVSPMALGLGEGGDQIAPLGVAVIGGLLFSLVSTLFFLPLVYHHFVGKRPYQSPSLHPTDTASVYYQDNT
ncbi:efflux RND transporter permease subunit [Nitritalea halalkaliphila]|uniref:efflux RND transporter permease subunit n=1 Tax=Nitritalea halalkaliphila TaxID=590849 RepID=UPI00030B0BD2|nr:efflux RND transporter permease subunit [Nitritalea halalkaliphila]